MKGRAGDGDLQETVESKEALTESSRKPITIISIANVLMRHRALLIVVPLIAVAVALTYKLLQPTRYRADSTFMPESGRASSSRLAGLAAQFGVDVGVRGGDASENLQFYAQLIRSRELLREVATSPYSFAPASEPGVKQSGTLVELYQPDASTAEGRTRQVIAMLQQDVTVVPDALVGVVNLSVTAPWPELAVLINARLLALVNDFNLRRRQSQARAEREFAETSLANARRDQALAEQNLERFLRENRSYGGSPQLSFEMRRLQQQVDFRQQIATSLATSYAQAQLNEIRNTPVVTVIDPPELSARKIPRGLLTAVLLALFLGFFIAAGLAFMLDYLKVQRAANPEDFREFQALKRSASLSRFSRFRRERNPGVAR